MTALTSNQVQFLALTVLHVPRLLDSDLGFGVRGSGFGVWCLMFGVWGLGFGVWVLGLGVWGLGFGVEAPPRELRQLMNENFKRNVAFENAGSLRVTMMK